MTYPTWQAQGGPRYPMPQVENAAPSRSCLFTTALLVATITSVASTISLIVYVLVGVFAGAAQQSRLSVLYQIGIIGLYVAEGCQILGVLALLRQWLSRKNIKRKPRELIVLLLSLIPYMLVIVFLITLIVYLRARRRDPASQRTREAKQELKEQGVDALIDAGANTMNSASETPFAPAAAGGSRIAPGGAPAAPANSSSQASVRPQTNLRDAVRQVIGPSTSRQLSQTAQGVIAFAMIVLLISAVASVGVGIPAQLVTFVRSNLPGQASHTSLAGNWAVVFTNPRCTPTCANTVERDVFTIQQIGNTLTAIGTSPSGGETATELVTGTITGSDMFLKAAVTVSKKSCFWLLIGKVLSANEMAGANQITCVTNGVQEDLTSDWTATRTSSAVGAPVKSLVGAWNLSLAHCITCVEQFNEDYTVAVQQSGNTLTVKASFFGCTAGASCALDMTGGVSGTNVNMTGHYAGNGCQITLTGRVISAYEMSGTTSFQCSKKQYTDGFWTALRT